MIEVTCPHTTPQSPAVEVGGLLPIELAFHSATVLSGAEPLEAIIDKLGVFLVEVLMGHDIRGAGIHLVASHLQQYKNILPDNSITREKKKRVQ